VEYLTIAIAKGRLVNHTIDILHAIGINFPDYHEKSRKLIFEDPVKKIRIVLVKASDVATYVERGATDLGVIGKDSLIESDANVFEVVDLGFGRCRFVVAGLETTVLQKNKFIVATKYPKVTNQFFTERGQTVETIHLNGSVELAPLVGLSDCIVDIVETGRTLKDNGLKVLAEIFDISARLIVNKASFKTKHSRIDDFINHIQSVVAEKGAVG
jgi:ATP phosphoribosyltransferase